MGKGRLKVCLMVNRTRIPNPTGVVRHQNRHSCLSDFSEEPEGEGHRREKVSKAPQRRKKKRGGCPWAVFLLCKTWVKAGAVAVRKMMKGGPKGFVRAQGVAQASCSFLV